MLLALEIIAWLVLFVFALRGARWAYAVFVVLAFVWIPARTGFHLHPPPCRMQFTLELAVGSLIKYKHIVLWAAFFVIDVGPISSQPLFITHCRDRDDRNRRPH